MNNRVSKMLRRYSNTTKQSYRVAKRKWSLLPWTKRDIKQMNSFYLAMTEKIKSKAEEKVQNASK